MNLRQIQSSFQSYVIALDPGIMSSIQEPPSVPPGTRLEIYAEAYRLRLVEVLGEYYPGLRSLLGTERFDALAVAFIDHNPSRRFSVRWFGAGLAEFLTQSPAFSSQPASAEMAAFEWGLGLAFDAADTPPLERRHLAAVPANEWPCLRLVFHPSVRRLDLHCNVPPLWTALTTGGSAPGERTGPPESWLIWRPRLNPQFRSLQRHEAEALDAAIAGRPFGELCELLTQHFPHSQVPTEAAALINQWLIDRMIVALDFAGDQ